MTATKNANIDTTTLEVSVSVDGNHCHFYAICAAEAPAVFRLPTDGRLRYTVRGGILLSSILDLVRRSSCPYCGCRSPSWVSGWPCSV